MIQPTINTPTTHNQQYTVTTKKTPRTPKSPKTTTATKKAPARKRNPDQPTAVGRGRLPSADTDKKFLDAVKIHGKDFVGIGSYINKTSEAAKKYWERHCDRLGLEKMVGGGGAGVAHDGGAVVAAATTAATAATAATASGGTSTGAATAVPVAHHPIPTLPAAADVPAAATTNTFQNNNDGQTTSQATAKKRPREGKIWSEADKQALFAAFSLHGRDWKKLHETVPSKTLTQVKNFYQNYKEKFVVGAGGSGGVGVDVGGNGTAAEKQQDDSPPEKQPKLG